MKKLIAKINEYFERKRYDVILHDRKHLTDYEKEQFIPDLKDRLNILKQYFSDVIKLCETQRNSRIFTEAAKSIINPTNAAPDLQSPQETIGEKFFDDIKTQVQQQGIDDIDKILKKFKDIQNLKQLGLFLTELNYLCSSLTTINNRLLLYKVETYPYFEDTKTGQVITTHPKEYFLVIEPFQILVTNIVNVAKTTADTITGWRTQALKLKSQYLDLYTNRLSIKNTKLVLYIQILTIILAIVLSAFFLTANDPFNLYKENQKLKQSIKVVAEENIKLKILNKKRIAN
ncbi:MAG: hypothetical protein KKF54_02585 [Candidatus Omnitrophica bacterium]|nr:hypothetical protein [Candidatus Omnitrophota bacterium]